MTKIKSLQGTTKAVALRDVVRSEFFPSLVLVLTVGVEMGVGVDHVTVLVAVGVNQISTQEKFAIGQDLRWRSVGDGASLL